MKRLNIKNILVSAAMVSLMSGCAQMSESAKTGAGVGALGGAGVAALAGGSSRQVVGGAVVGAVAGGLIGESMNK